MSIPESISYLPHDRARPSAILTPPTAWRGVYQERKGAARAAVRGLPLVSDSGTGHPPFVLVFTPTIRRKEREAVTRALHLALATCCPAATTTERAVPPRAGSDGMQRTTDRADASGIGQVAANRLAQRSGLRGAGAPVRHRGLCCAGRRHWYLPARHQCLRRCHQYGRATADREHRCLPLGHQ